MCGCDKHLNEQSECTCMCPEHKNFERAYNLALARYYEIVRLEEALSDVATLVEKAEEVRLKWDGSRINPESTFHFVDPDDLRAILDRKATQ